MKFSEDIKLEELPKSENFLDYINFTNELTHGSGKEYGFNFCKKNKKILVDKICSGTNCIINITPNICDVNDNSFHTHPNRQLSELSVGDLFSSIDKSYSSKKPNISCVKSEFDENIICKKVNTQKMNFYNFNEIAKLHKEFKNEQTYEKHEETYNKIERKIKLETIIFDIKTKKSLYY